ncbi:hypothetical protein DV515_00016496, partial [Chloebia gouldiae]
LILGGTGLILGAAISGPSNPNPFPGHAAPPAPAPPIAGCRHCQGYPRLGVPAGAPGALLSRGSRPRKPQLSRGSPNPGSPRRSCAVPTARPGAQPPPRGDPHPPAPPGLCRHPHRDPLKHLPGTPRCPSEGSCGSALEPCQLQTSPQKPQTQGAPGYLGRDPTPRAPAGWGRCSRAEAAAGAETPPASAPPPSLLLLPGQDAMGKSWRRFGGNNGKGVGEGAQGEDAMGKGWVTSKPSWGSGGLGGTMGRGWERGHRGRWDPLKVLRVTPGPPGPVPAPPVPCPCFFLPIIVCLWGRSPTSPFLGGIMTALSDIFMGPPLQAPVGDVLFPQGGFLGFKGRHSGRQRSLGGLGVSGGFGGPGRIWGYLGDAVDRAGTPVSVFREILGGLGVTPKPQGAPNAQGPPELPSPLDLLQAGDTSTRPPPPPSQGGCGRNLGVHAQVGGTPKVLGKEEHRELPGIPTGGLGRLNCVTIVRKQDSKGPAVPIPSKRGEILGWLGIGVLGGAAKGRNRGKGGSGGWERRKGLERGGCRVEPMPGMGVWGDGSAREWGFRGPSVLRNGADGWRIALPTSKPEQKGLTAQAEPGSSWPCRAEAFPRCWAQTDGAALLNTGAHRGTSSSCLWPPKAPRPKLGADRAGRDWQAPCWLCCPTCAHLGAPSASRDLRWQPWAPGGCARNGAGDSLSMGNFQMEKAAAENGGSGPRDLCQSHTLGEQRAQQEGQNQAKLGSRSSCSIALLEKALGWFKVLKGVEGREEATPNTAPVSQPPLSVSQKELDGLCSSLQQLSTRSWRS